MVRRGWRGGGVGAGEGRAEQCACAGGYMCIQWVSGSGGHFIRQTDVLLPVPDPHTGSDFPSHALADTYVTFLSASAFVYSTLSHINDDCPGGGGFSFGTGTVPVDRTGAHCSLFAL